MFYLFTCLRCSSLCKNLKNVFVCASDACSQGRLVLCVYHCEALSSFAFQPLRALFWRLTLHLGWYVNAGKCVSVILVVITWFTSDAVQILKDLQEEFIFSYLCIVLIDDKYFVNAGWSMWNCRLKKLTVNKTDRGDIKADAWHLFGLCNVKYLGEESPVISVRAAEILMSEDESWCHCWMTILTCVDCTCGILPYRLILAT